MTAQNSTRQLSIHARELLDRIGYPNSLPIELQNARIIETHISVLLIGASYVLKLKKIIAFAFVDHTSLAQRWNSAVNEVVLNRRLSSDIYLGVISIFQDKPFAITDCRDVNLTSSMPSDLLEVGVLMETIDQATLLSNLIEQQQVMLDKHIIPLAKRIAEFHKTQLLAKPLRLEAAPDIAQLARDNISILKQHAAKFLTTSQQAMLEKVSDYTEAFLAQNLSTLQQREASGWIIDGHGDLRAEHVCFSDNEVSVIDCIEFNDDIRRVDILNDIAFLRMDLDLLKQGHLANALITTYSTLIGAAASNDALLVFYSCYRAMVRAKIQLLRVIELQSDNNPELSPQIAQEQQKINRYLGLAHRYSLAIPTPCLIAIGGLMGVGKSTLAEWLAEQTYATMLNSDVVRKQLYGSDSTDKNLEFGAQKYSAESTEHTYQELLNLAARELENGNPVIVDSSFIKRHHRDAVFNIATKANAAVVFIWCELDEQTQRQRLIARSATGTAISDGRVELSAMQRASFENFSADEQNIVLKVSTKNLPNLATLETICQRLVRS